MNWYIAKMVFNISIDNGKHTTQFDEQTRLIQATSIEDAFFKARHLGKQEEDSFTNKDNKSVTWKFIDIADLYALQNVKDGEQLYSTTHEKEDSDSFIKLIRHKSMVIQTKSLTFA